MTRHLEFRSARISGVLIPDANHGAGICTHIYRINDRNANIPYMEHMGMLSCSFRTTCHCLLVLVSWTAAKDPTRKCVTFFCWYPGSLGIPLNISQPAIGPKNWRRTATDLSLLLISGPTCRKSAISCRAWRCWISEWCSLGLLRAGGEEPGFSGWPHNS